MDSSKKLVICLAATAFTTSLGLYMWRNRKKRLAVEKIASELMGIFDSTDVYVRDPATLRGKLRHLVEDGKNKLQVLSDFDMTISKYLVGGERGDTSHGAIEKATCMPADFRMKALELKSKYAPLEHSLELSYQEKSDLMVEWWSGIHALMLEAGFERRWIPGVVSEATICLRDGADEFFEILKEDRIPLYIVSAGVGDIIEEAITKESTLYENTKIISNFMDFNETGHLIGFKGELLHSYNKKEIVNHASAYFDESSDRTNLMLIGDTLGDPTMSDGMKHLSTVLKIGFLNYDSDAALDAYEQVYDIVIVNDHTMDVINVFIQELVQNK
eukprot:gene17512-19262_t